MAGTKFKIDRKQRILWVDGYPIAFNVFEAFTQGELNVPFVITERQPGGPITVKYWNQRGAE